MIDEAFEEYDDIEEVPMSPDEIELLQLAEELGINLQDPNVRLDSYKDEDFPFDPYDG